MTNQGQPASGGADNESGVNLSETARHLQMSVTTLNRWAENGWLTSSMTPSGERVFERLPAAAVRLQQADGE